MLTQTDELPRYEDMELQDRTHCIRSDIERQGTSPDTKVDEDACIGSTKRPGLRIRLTYYANKVLPQLAIPLGALVGMGVAAGAIYGLHTAITKSGLAQPDPSRWAHEARRLVYDACYFGCHQCDDPSYAWGACARSAKVIATAADGSRLHCDAGAMWNWPDHERYPGACLSVMGETLRLEEIARTIKDRRTYYIFIILIVLLGLVLGIATYCSWEWLAAGCVRRECSMRSQAIAWKAAKKKSGRSGLPTLATAAVGALVMAGRAQAFPCVDSSSVYKVPFVDERGVIAGAVSGWMSDCVQTEVCVEHYDTKGPDECKRYQRFAQKQPGCLRQIWAHEISFFVRRPELG